MERFEKCSSTDFDLSEAAAEAFVTEGYEVYYDNVSSVLCVVKMASDHDDQEQQDLEIVCWDNSAKKIEDFFEMLALQIRRERNKRIHQSSIK